MDLPKLTHYVKIICTLFERFEQQRMKVKEAKSGSQYTYSEQGFIVFFLLMQFRRKYQFKSQWRWLTHHPEMVTLLGWEGVPHRKTISTRYKGLYETLQAFMMFCAQYTTELNEAFGLSHLVEDKSLFKALGPVWHQSDRLENRIPDKLRHLDTEATWSKSGYHGWVYGFGLHLTCTQDAFPVLIQVETANVSESQVVDQKAELILDQLQPETLATDNSYAKALRIRRWAKRGVALLSPAYKWITGRYAKAYHRFINQPFYRDLLIGRRTSVEPCFDLIAKVLGTQAKQKQLPVQRLDNVRSCLALASFSVQLAMIVNSIWGLPHRNVSHIYDAFS